MEKIYFLLITIIFTSRLFSLQIYIDNNKLKNFLNKFGNVNYVKEVNNADIIFYNGINNKINDGRAYDYTVGIENVIYSGKRKINKYFLSSFENYKKAITNITKVFKIYFPKYINKYNRKLSREIDKINNIINDVNKDKMIIFKRGKKYDYLLREFNIKHIDVDKYFIYKEKAYRKYGIKKIYLFKKFEKQYVTQLQNYGYEFEKITPEGKYPYYLIDIIKEIKNG